MSTEEHCICTEISGCNYRCTVKMLIHCQIINRLDYCNYIYYNLPKYQLKKLQLVMNKAARLVKRLPLYERITPTIIELHWLPIKTRIVFKICVLVYQALRTGKPDYVRCMLKHYQLGTSLLTRQAADEYRLEEPRCNTSVGSRAFKYCAPKLYNSLPIDVKSCTDVHLLKKKLKTFIFNDCFNIRENCITENYAL